jgi:molecular chaperone IbpA
MTYAYGKNILPMTVGFDRLLSTFEEVDKLLENAKPPSFPPHNIIKLDDYNYEIQIAVAGFSPENIDVETNQNKLIVSGTCEKLGDGVQYIYRGLSSRDFKQTYTLSDISVVRSANITNGVLSISIENVIPDEQKPRKIPIGVDKKLLIEDK